MIGPWSPPSCPTRRRSRRSARCCPRRAPGSTSTRGPRGRCRPRPSWRWTSWRHASWRSGARAPDGFDEVQQRWAELRASIAAVIVADPDDVAMTHSTTDGMNLAVNALPWREGDRVMTTRHEHPGGLGPLFALRERLGIEVEMVDIGRRRGRASARSRRSAPPSSGLPARSSPATCLWTTGAVLPIARLGALARDAGAATIIDGAQSAGAIPIDIESLDVDAYAIPGQKWLLGPEGMGALWARRALGGRRRARERRLHLVRVLRPEPAGAPPGRPPVRVRILPSPVRRRASPGAAAGCRCTSACRGPTSAPRDSRRRARTGWRRSTACRSSPRAIAMGTLVTFRIGGWPAADAVRELGARTFAIIRDLPAIDAIRISVGFWNTEEELERFAQGVELLAAHTPESMPPRRTLAVLGSATTRRSGDRRAHAARRAARGPAAGLRRGPLAPVPARAAAGVPGGDVEPVRRARPRRSLFLAYDIALDRGATLPGGDLRLLAPHAVRRDRADRRRGADVPRGAAAHRRRRPPRDPDARGASRSGCSPRCRSRTSSSSSCTSWSSRSSPDRERPAMARSGTIVAPDRPIDTALHRAGMIHADQPPHPTLEDSRGQRRTPHGAAKAVRRTRVRTAGRPCRRHARSRSIRTTCRSRRT